MDFGFWKNPFKALKGCAATSEKWARHRTSSYCLLSMITRGEQVDLSCNNKHISDAWQVMASSGNKKPLQFTVSNADSCRRKSFLLSDVPASFSIKALSKKKHQFSSWRLIQSKHQISLTPKGATPATYVCNRGGCCCLALLPLSHMTWRPHIINKLNNNLCVTWSARNIWMMKSAEISCVPKMGE